MAVPSSGPLGLFEDIWDELDGSKGSNSLHSASIHAGFSTPDAMGDFYGYVDAEAPTLTSSNATSVGTTTMVANGSMTNNGGANLTAHGFYFGTNSGAAGNNTKYDVGARTGTSFTFNRTFTSLSSNTTYYYWAFATNSVGETIASNRITQATNLPGFGTSWTQMPGNNNGGFATSPGGSVPTWVSGGNTSSFPGGQTVTMTWTAGNVSPGSLTKGTFNGNTSFNSNSSGFTLTAGPGVTAYGQKGYLVLSSPGYSSNSGPRHPTFGNGITWAIGT